MLTQFVVWCIILLTLIIRFNVWYYFYMKSIWDADAAKMVSRVHILAVGKSLKQGTGVFGDSLLD